MHCLADAVRTNQVIGPDYSVSSEGSKPVSSCEYRGTNNSRRLLHNDFIMTELFPLVETAEAGEIISVLLAARSINQA